MGDETKDALTSPDLSWAMGVLPKAGTSTRDLRPGILLRWADTQTGRQHANAVLNLLRQHGFLSNLAQQGTLDA